jgi:hypothetical protein
VILATLIPIFPALVIRDTETNRLVWSGQIADDGTFAIRWTHSINRTPVVETYRVRNGQIILSELTFQDYGIGMESQLADDEQLISRKWFVSHRQHAPRLPRPPSVHRTGEG